MLELNAEERRTCREALRNLLGKVYQPIVIKELLVLQGGPKQVCMCMFDREIIAVTVVLMLGLLSINPKTLNGRIVMMYTFKTQIQRWVHL